MPPEMDPGSDEPAEDEGHLPGFTTRAVHDGEMPPGGIAEQPVSSPIWLTSDYLYEGLDHYADVINERRPGFVYGRYGNPTHVALHRVLASLEGAEAAWSFGSGMAAIHTTLTTLAGEGEHVVAQKALYGGTYSLFTKQFPRYGIEVSLVDPEADAVAAAIGPRTRVVFLETLANPTFRVSDVAGVARVCAEAGVALVVDNTVPSPYLFRPLDHLGVSLVVHATTKYAGGHSDLIGGSVAGPRDLVEPIRKMAIDQGTTAGAFEDWLTLRGIQTLALRMERQCANAMVLARLFDRHSKVEDVGYSGLPGHPDHQRASALFPRGLYGAMLSFSLQEGYEAAQRLTGSLRVTRVGSSFGSMRSQICHPATTSHRQLPPKDRAAAGIGEGLLRLAVGGEDPDDLEEDFAQALEKA
jgi:cystathionine beta-lyase/cystathionine gamma-synthase